MTTQARRDRESQGLTQTEAAIRAGVSLATWRRWEAAPASVKSQTAQLCEAVLRGRDPSEVLELDKEIFTEVWRDHPVLTPRQAYFLVLTISLWIDLYWKPWLAEHDRDPLYELPPFDQLSLRVHMLIPEPTSWVAAAVRRAEAVIDELRDGTLPFGRPGCYMDELLLALSVSEFEAFNDDPERLDGIPLQAESEEWANEDDYAFLEDRFDDRSRWGGDLFIPLYEDSALLRPFLDAHPPHIWFDPAV